MFGWSCAPLAELERLVKCANSSNCSNEKQQGLCTPWIPWKSLDFFSFDSHSLKYNHSFIFFWCCSTIVLISLLNSKSPCAEAAIRTKGTAELQSDAILVNEVHKNALNNWTCIQNHTNALNMRKIWERKHEWMHSWLQCSSMFYWGLLFLSLPLAYQGSHCWWPPDPPAFLLLSFAWRGRGVRKWMELVG